MGQFDVQRLKTARIYLARMADGRNPATNQPVQNELLDNPNVIRCLNFVAEVLREVEENNGVVGRTGTKKQSRQFAPEDLKSFEYRSDGSIMQILRQLREPFEGERVRGLDAKKINQKLAEKGYLVKTVPGPGLNECWMPTPEGEAAGLYALERIFDNNHYFTVMYNQEGQELLIRVIEEMLSRSIS